MLLREILRIPAFERFQVVAGRRGLDRDVSTVSVMDAPDIYEWMRGGEFLITSGYVMKDDPEYITKMVEKLDEWGASAFGIKLGRFIDQIPPSAVEAAERLNFPLLIIPVEFAFTEVINPVLQEVVNRKSREMIYSENVHREFIRMAIEERSIAEILQMLEQYISRSAVYFDVNFHRAYFSEENPDDSLQADALAVARREQSVETLIAKYPSYQIKTSGEQYGYLFFGEKRGDSETGMENYHQITMEQAGVVLIIKVQKLLAERRIEGDYRELFVEDLLKANFRTREEIANRARIYGWNFTDGGYAVILSVDNMKAHYTESLDRERGKSLADMMEKITQISADIVKKTFPLSVYRWASDQVMLAVSTPDSGRSTIAAQCRAVFEQVRQTVRQAMGQTLTIGVGTYKKDFYEVSESYREASKAIGIALEQGKHDCITFYDELGIIKLLSRMSKSEEARELCAEYIQKLRAYDEAHGTNLLQTLQTVVSCEWNLKKASEQLYIHYNSMKYRYRRICQVLDKRLDDADEKLNMEIALKLDAMRSSRL